MKKIFLRTRDVPNAAPENAEALKEAREQLPDILKNL